LGFDPYVRALAEFLTNPDTKPPLTLSIEGEWGSGKSSFMLQLEQALRRAGEQRDQRFKRPGARARGKRKPLTVWFNAWRHDKESALWAAFAIEFARQLSSRRFFLRRWWGHLLLVIQRFRWRSGWPEVIRALSLWMIIFGCAMGVPVVGYLKGADWLRAFSMRLSEKEGLQQLVQLGTAAGGVLGYIAALLSAWIKLRRFVRSALEVDLDRYLRSPDYKCRVSFVEQFHEDFTRIVGCYAGNRTVYVFIDDLDRCEVPRAAELMQGLNLMISSDPRLIFIVGMDREKVAAGLAVKYEKILPYLCAGRSPSEDGSSKTFDRLTGLEFGYEFIEKFVQLPFAVPDPTQANFQLFLDGSFKATRLGGAAPGLFEKMRQVLWERRSSPMGNGDRHTPRELPTEVTVESEGTSVRRTVTGPTEAQNKRREGIKVRVAEDSETVREVILVVASALDYNPRRVKQFVNLSGYGRSLQLKRGCLTL
jgi:hypothetical protein